MCVYIYIYIYACAVLHIYIYMHIYAYIYIYTHKHTHVYTCTCIHIHICMFVCFLVVCRKAWVTAPPGEKSLGGGLAASNQHQPNGYLA